MRSPKKQVQLFLERHRSVWESVSIWGGGERETKIKCAIRKSVLDQNVQGLQSFRFDIPLLGPTFFNVWKRKTVPSALDGPREERTERGEAAAEGGSGLAPSFPISLPGSHPSPSLFSSWNSSWTEAAWERLPGDSRE